MEELRPAKGLDEMFCPSCGAIIKREAVICVKCGVAVHGHGSGARSKDKTVAVILAVLCGLWTWCYTYRKDAWKFWLNLALSVVTLGIWGIVAWVWAIIDTARRPVEFFANFDQAVGGQGGTFSLPAMPPTDPDGLKTYRRNQLLTRISTANKYGVQLEQPSILRRTVLPVIGSIVASTLVLLPVLGALGPRLPGSTPSKPDFPAWYSSLIFICWILGCVAAFLLLRAVFEKQRARKLDEFQRKRASLAAEMELEFPDVVQALGGSKALQDFRT